MDHGSVQLLPGVVEVPVLRPLLQPFHDGVTLLAVLDLAHVAPPHARAGTQRLGVFHEQGRLAGRVDPYQHTAGA